MCGLIGIYHITQSRDHDHDHEHAGLAQAVAAGRPADMGSYSLSVRTYHHWHLVCVLHNIWHCAGPRAVHGTPIIITMSRLALYILTFEGRVERIA